MKQVGGKALLFVLSALIGVGMLHADYPGQDDTYPYAPRAGKVGSTAIHKDDLSILAWAIGYEDLIYGDAVSDSWKTPEKALGPAEGTSLDIMSLGRGGQIALTFEHAITDAAGADFVVFENSFSDGFLELAWVEVSTDGVHYVRFPNFSYTADPVGSFGNVDPTFIHGFAGKYRQAYGTPFDLEQLQVAYDSALAETDLFSPAYEASLEANFPHLNLDEINYVRLVDVVGDGNGYDSEGYAIYEPYPTNSSAGFDLDAVGVLNQLKPDSLAQSIDFSAIAHQRLTDGSLFLEATASSGLAVEFTVLEGPANVVGNLLTFMGRGTVWVQASQVGNATYAAATPVAHSFVIADELQHIYLQPIANQIVGAIDVPVRAIASSGMPVSLWVDVGPAGTNVDQLEPHLLDASSEAGVVTVRATRAGATVGDVVYAPAEDVSMSFELVDAGALAAPLSFSAWQAGHSISGGARLDSDQDGVSDYQEYASGTNPNLPGDRPAVGIKMEPSACVLQLRVSRTAMVDVDVLYSTDLSPSGKWANVIPEIVSVQSDAQGQTLRLRFVHDATKTGFWRVAFSSNE